MCSSLPAYCSLPNPLCSTAQPALSCPARSYKRHGAQRRASLQSTKCFVTVLCRSSTPHCADERPSQPNRAGCPRLGEGRSPALPPGTVLRVLLRSTGTSPGAGFVELASSPGTRSPPRQPHTPASAAVALRYSFG